MPSSYYKLRGVDGVSGGRFTDPEDSEQRSKQREISFTDTINQRVVGSRFQEVNRNSTAYGRLPLGSHIQVSESGELGPQMAFTPTMTPSAPESMRFGPNQDWSPPPETYNSGHDSFFQRSQGVSRVPSELGGEWVDVLREPPQRFDNEPDYAPIEPEIMENRRRHPRVTATPSSETRESFPLRARNGETQSVNILPPHLRLQFQQPFVRPLSGIDHDNLGDVYTDISHWRTRLKAINAEIADSQRDCYGDIADGVRTKGWLMVGKGLKFLPGIELIEGRSKEDVRWDELQHGGGTRNAVAFWALVVMVVILLAAALTAAAGLTLATSPGVTRHLPFLEKLANSNNLATGLIVVLCPTLGATLFIVLAIALIHRELPLPQHLCSILSSRSKISLDSTVMCPCQEVS